MSNFAKHFFLTATASLFCFFTAAFAGTFNEADIREMLAKDGKMNKAQIDSVVTAMKNASPNHEISISGALFSPGWNGAFFKDTGTTNFSASYKDETGKKIRKSEPISATFRDGGFPKIEVAYRFVFVFLSDTLSLESLHGTTFGRGFGLTSDIPNMPVIPVGAELGFAPSTNDNGFAFIVVGKLGLVAPALLFPALEF